MVVLYRQRLYLNLSLALDVAARLPGISAEDAERMILGGGATAGGAPEGPSVLPHRPAASACASCAWAAASRGEIAEAERLVSALALARTRSRGASRAAGRPPRAWADVGRRVAATHVLTSGASAAALSVLARMLEAFARGPAAERASRLTAGLQEVESAAPTLALEALAGSSRPTIRGGLASGSGPTRRGRSRSTARRRKCAASSRPSWSDSAIARSPKASSLRRPGRTIRPRC